MKKQKPYKVSATWWIGWVVLWPFRFSMLIFLAFFSSIGPSIFYGEMNNCTLEKDQSKWKL